MDTQDEQPNCKAPTVIAEGSTDTRPCGCRRRFSLPLHPPPRRTLLAAAEVWLHLFVPSRSLQPLDYVEMEIPPGQPPCPF